MNEDEKELVFLALSEIQKNNRELVSDSTSRKVDKKLGEIQSERYDRNEEI